MASESKMMERIRKYEERLSKNRKELGEHRKGSVPGVAVVAGPFVRAGSAYAHGFIDGKIGTAANQHPASIVGGVLSMLAGGALAVMGHPTAAAIVVDVGSGPLDGLAWSKGRDMATKTAATPAAPAG